MLYSYKSLNNWHVTLSKRKKRTNFSSQDYKLNKGTLSETTVHRRAKGRTSRANTHLWRVLHFNHLPGKIKESRSWAPGSASSPRGKTSSSYTCTLGEQNWEINRSLESLGSGSVTPVEGLYFCLASLRAERLQVMSQSETFRRVVVTIQEEFSSEAWKLWFYSMPFLNSYPPHCKSAYKLCSRKPKYIWLKIIIHRKLMAIRVIWSKKHF